MILSRLRAGCDEAEGQGRTVAVDATVVRAHQHAAGARRAPPADVDPARLAPAVLSDPARLRGAGQLRSREALGRSRGGLTSKIHLLADSRCRPLARVTSAGQRHDSLAFAPLMDQLKIARRCPGRPRTRPGRVLGDKACSSSAIRAHLRRRGIKAAIPEPADQARSAIPNAAVDLPLPSPVCTASTGCTRRSRVVSPSSGTSATWPCGIRPPPPSRG